MERSRSLADALARLRTALVAAAVERHRLRLGALPETLDALVPDLLARVPVDPYSGQALRYRRVDDRYAVYSVGADRKDDGGTSVQWLSPRWTQSRGRDPQKPGDIGVEVKLTRRQP